MGYCIDQVESKFFIANDDKAEALFHIKQMPARRFAWVDESFKKQDTLEGVLQEWRYSPSVDEEGNITDIFFEGEKYGDDLNFFKVLAPFVKEGSYIAFHGEDGAHFRFLFENNDCTEQEAKISYV